VVPCYKHGHGVGGLVYIRLHKQLQKLRICCWGRKIWWNNVVEAQAQHAKHECTMWRWEL